MDARVAKLALARKKLRDHQDKKFHKGDVSDHNIQSENSVTSTYKQNEHGGSEITVPLYHEENNVASESFSAIHNDTNNPTAFKTDINPETKTTEVLISDRRDLELQINDLQLKITQLESNYNILLTNNNIINQQNGLLETELKTLSEKYNILTNQHSHAEKVIEEYKSKVSSVVEENNTLLEQLDFTKSVLTSKEAEYANLLKQFSKLQNEFDATELRLQQLTNGSMNSKSNDKIVAVESETNEEYVQKISHLENQLKCVQKERDQLNSHYEHYVTELNQELKLSIKKCEDLTKENNLLTIRENNLIEQISNMEIQLQTLRNSTRDNTEERSKQSNNDVKVQEEYAFLLTQFDTLQAEHNDLKKKYIDSERKIQELEARFIPEQQHEDICISKLNADITNDKIAAQSATKQNKKLKTDLQELEEAFVKMSKDKLELTEKLEAEKFLNRELTIKLADNVEIAKDMQIKLKAKDDEMIRLQSNLRDMEKQFSKSITQDIINTDYDNAHAHIDCHSEQIENPSMSRCPALDYQTSHSHCSVGEMVIDEKSNNNHVPAIVPKQDAMLKLQERFLKIMEEVADLSDEKHRLEHIIMQLQNETDTICEYVALYQQQRCLLKQKDEERTAQIKIFQSECDRLKSQLTELDQIITKLAADSELAAYFQTGPRHSDISNILGILQNMKTNFLVNSGNQCTEMKNFYPCACCSGNLIDL